MPQANFKLSGELTTFIKVQKVDGRVMYYAVRDGVNEEITKEQYDKEHDHGSR